MLQRSFWRI